MSAVWRATWLAVVAIAASRRTNAQERGAEHPVYARSECPSRLWQPDEIPQVYIYTRGPCTARLNM
jgi:hypothetical protein